MKKMFIAFAVGAFALASQAASLKWGGAICDPDGTSEMSAGSLAWLIWSDSAFSGVATELDTSTGVANNGGTIVSSHNISASDISAFAFQEDYGVTGAGVDGYYAILVADGANLAKAAYYDMGSITGTTATSPTSNLLLNLDWSGDQFLNQGGYTATVKSAAVPEPTSGLLILVGLAGLALKRKRA